MVVRGWLSLIVLSFAVLSFAVLSIAVLSFPLRRSPFAVCHLSSFVVCCSLFVDCRLLVDVFWLFVFGCSWLVVVCCFVVRLFVDRRVVVPRSPFAVCHLSSFVVCCLLFVDCRLLVEVFWLLIVGCSWLVVVCHFVVRLFVNRRVVVLPRNVIGV